MKGRNKAALAVSLALVFLFMFLASRVYTGGGALSIRNLYYPDANGTILRAQLYVPRGVSSAHPAPGIVNMHGGGDNLECVSNFSVELARRGYVVLSVDAYGSGFSGYASGAVATAAGGSGNAAAPATKMDGGVTVSLQQMFSFAFVDQANIGLIGHSMGGTYIANAALAYPDKVKAIMPWGSGSFLDLIKKVKPEAFTFNVGFIDARSDEMILFATKLKDTRDLLKQDFMKAFFKTDQDIVANQVYGSFAARDARVVYTPSTSHAGNLVSHDSIAYLLGFFEQAMPTSSGIGVDDQVWQYKEALDALAIIALLCFIVSLGCVLLDSAAFRSLRIEGPQTVKMSGLMRAAGIAILIAIPMLTLYKVGLPLSTIKASKLFPMGWGNYYAWLAGIDGLIVAVLFLAWHFAYGKRHGGDARSYGLSLGTAGFRGALSQIIAAIGFALCVVFAVYAIFSLCYSLFNIDFRVWLFAMKPMTAGRIGYIGGYLIMYLIVLGALNTASISFAGISGEATGRWSVAKQYALGWAIGTAGYLILLLVYYVGLNSFHYPPLFIGYPPFTGGHPNSLVFSMKLTTAVPVFTFASIMNTAFYRKTRNIYVSTFAAALLLAMITAAGNAFTF
jgi:dienelactone hydrolase